MRKIFFVVCLAGSIASSNASPAPTPVAITPGSAIDYRPMAFYPERWVERKIDTRLYPWQGKQVVFLTTTTNFDGELMGRFLERLDGGWSLYRELSGRSPEVFKQLGGKPVIAAVPDDNLTCGYGCGYIGLSGIEVSGFYGSDYPLLRENRSAFPHYYFYEMGRNFYLFGDRHSLFITGYAVFMRYVCMDSLSCADPDQETRRTIERCEELYANSAIPFIDAFTNLGAGEKAHRLKDGEGREVSPSDQPVMYATAMLKLRRENGGDAWVKRFCAQLLSCPEVKAENRAGAEKQLLNWLVAASSAAGTDLSPVFCDRWRMPIAQSWRRALAKVDWTKPGTSAGSIVMSVSGGNNGKGR
jgi:hypothetical protein